MGYLIHAARCLMIFPIKLYQYLLSPYLGSCCRFYPTCSYYAIEAIDQHGIFKGLGLSMMRILRCHPWSKGGFDPVSSMHSDFHKNRKR